MAGLTPAKDRAARRRRPAHRRSSVAFALVAVLVVLGAVVGIAIAFRPDAGTPVAATHLPSSPADQAVPAESSTPPLEPAALAAPVSTAPVTSATIRASSPSTTSIAPVPTPALAFDVDRAMGHVRVLAEEIGVREEGSPNEDIALAYAADYLEGLGYTPSLSGVPLPNGRSSHNVRAVKEGASASFILVGAHIDSKAPAPGANDNASGVGVVLELARDLREADITASVEFVLFGAEEMIDEDPDHHHYGSRHHVQTMNEAERSRLVGMVSVDMVAYGDALVVRNMDRGPRELVDMVLANFVDRGSHARYAKDTGAYGWSDHEPFELAGYPVAWVEWRRDPAYHTEADTYGHCDPNLVGQTGEMLLGFLTRLTEENLAFLANARRSD